MVTIDDYQAELHRLTIELGKWRDQCAELEDAFFAAQRRIAELKHHLSPPVEDDAHV